jgi:hypothetical protein
MSDVHADTVKKNQPETSYDVAIQIRNNLTQLLNLIGRNITNKETC